MIGADGMFESFWNFIDRVKINMVFYWLNATGQKYPMWFIRMLDGKTSPVALVRDRDTQELYKRRPTELRDDFIAGLFEPTLVSQHINYRFVPNNFPYFVENGIVHFVLWIRPGHIIETDSMPIRYTISRYVMSRFQRPLDFCYFKNTKDNKSVPEIEHYHVFIKQYPSAWVFDMPVK